MQKALVKSPERRWWWPTAANRSSFANTCDCHPAVPRRTYSRTGSYLECCGPSTQNKLSWVKYLLLHANHSFFNFMPYRIHSVLTWSVCMCSIGHVRSWACKHCWTDRNAVWVGESGWFKKPCIRWGSRSPRGKGIFWGILAHRTTLLVTATVYAAKNQ